MTAEQKRIDPEKDKVIFVVIDDYGNVDYGANNLPGLDLHGAMGILQTAIMQMGSKAITMAAAAKHHSETNGIIKPQTELIVPR